MKSKTKNTRILLYLISTLKEREFEYYKHEVVRLKDLKTKYPDIKIYTYKYEIAINRLELLLKTSKELKTLELDLIYNF